MYWNKLLWIITLSCNEGSIGLRPECPWKARRYKITPDESVQYWYLFLFPPPPALLFFHLLSDQWWQNIKWFWRCSISVQVLLPMGTILGEVSASSRHGGFAFLFDWHPKSIAFNLNAYSSNCTSEVSCSLVVQNSWPICWSHEKFWPKSEYCLCSIRSNSDLNSIFTVQVIGCKLQHGPNFGFPSDPTFRFKCFFRSWQIVLTTIHCSSVSFVMKYCPISTAVRNPASVQNLLNLSCCDNFSIRPLYLRNRSSCARSSVEGMFVLITFGTNDGLDCPSTKSLPALPWQESYPSHIFWDCSVKTEQMNRNNCAKNSFKRLSIGTIMDRPFSTAFALEHSSGQWTRGSEDWVSAFCKFYPHLLRNSVPFSLWTVFTNWVPLVLWSKTEKWPLSCSKSSCK